MLSVSDPIQSKINRIRKAESNVHEAYEQINRAIEELSSLFDVRMSDSAAEQIHQQLVMMFDQSTKLEKIGNALAYWAELLEEYNNTML